jgi:hypothetical protein
MLFSASFLSLLQGQTFSISGYVCDKSTRETLIGASVQASVTGRVAVTDKNGYFVITGLPGGQHTLSISYIGYTSEQVSVEIKNEGIILDEIKLKPIRLKLDEVSIVSVMPDRMADKEIETSQKTLSAKLIQSIPSARNDVFSAIKYLPGIDRTEPFSPLYSARGGDPGENAVLLDGVMIYNPYHSAITSGIFNTHSIKNVDMLVGGFGAEFGGRNSSVMYITTKDGNTNELNGEIEPSTFHSKLFLEFPAGDNASMVVAGRYLYNIPYNFLFHSTNYFYDINLSYTLRINNRNRISIKLFDSRDFTGYNFNTFYRYLGNSFDTDVYDDFTLQQRNSWRNQSATLIHKWVISPRVYLRSQVYYSGHKSDNYSGLDFLFSFPDANQDTVKLEWSSSTMLNSAIQDLSAKTSLYVKIDKFNELKLGAEYNNYYFENGISINQIDNGNFQRSPELLSLYLEDKLSTPYFILRPGVRFSQYRNGEWNYEPRVNLSLLLPNQFRIRAAYGQYLQYIISMNTNEIEMNQMVDYYYPIWDRPASKSVHYILGFDKRVGKNLSFSIDAYFKDILSTYTFDSNQELAEAYVFSNRLQQGLGKAYGLEFFVNGRFKKLTGWVSYSLAWATRQYPDSKISDGEEYPYDYNRRHTVKTVLNYQLTPNFGLNSSFLFLSGIPRSIETTTQSYFTYDPATNQTGYFPLYGSSDKNAAKMPPVINLDFSIRRKLISGFGKKMADILRADESYVSITIQNVLFLYRNVEYYLPGTFTSVYYDKYIPLGSNYIPRIGLSYTLKF